jgi:hypothetical protein
LDRLENIAWLGNTRPVDLRLCRSFGARGSGRSGADTLEMNAHTLGFIELKRTGMRLLLGYAYIIKHVEDSSALYFQFTR